MNAIKEHSMNRVYKLTGRIGVVDNQVKALGRGLCWIVAAGLADYGRSSRKASEDESSSTYHVE